VILADRSLKRPARETRGALDRHGDGFAKETDICHLSESIRIP
jgi:hypothetical protein